MTVATASTQSGAATRDVTLHHQVAGGVFRASVDLVGGGLRALSFGGVDIVETYPARTAAPYCSGAILFPWPNRVRDGRWTQRGIDHQLVITELERGNANHGLVLSTPFLVERRTESEVAVSVSVAPQPGYPFQLRLQVTYRLTDGGLEVDYRVTNQSGWPAPVALGAHPYLRIGECPTAELTVQVAASTYLDVDAQLIPISERPVTDTAIDLRAPRMIGDIELNTCFGHLEVVDGRSRTIVAARNAREVELWADISFGYVQIYTCPNFPRSTSTGLALAVEPMTAPADALNSGVGLKWLEPEDEWEVSWGIRPRGRTEDWNQPRVID
jgi:aldose 1-epimerase